MNPIPSGRVLATAEGGRDLILVRTFRAPVEDVWASITESERTARWFGPWRGEPGTGNTIQYQMTFEEGVDTSRWLEMTIVRCDPPRHLSLSAVDEWGSWQLELQLEETDGVTELRFVQHLDEKTNVADVGPGWEFYLDALVASRHGQPRPKWEDYYPAQKEHYGA